MELDQFRNVDLVIDRANDSFVQRQFVSQGDYKGRSLTVQVTDNGAVGEVAGLALNLQWHNKASGLTDLSAFTVIDKASSVFRIEYPQYMMTPGEVVASIQVLQDGKSTFLKSFTLTVQQLAGQAVGIAQQAEFSALVAVLADSNKFRTDIDILSKNKTDKTYVDSMLSSIAQGGPRELFYSLTALKSKYPSGADGTYLVFDSATTDGAHSYMWDTANLTWKDLGTYQAAGIADGSITNPKLGEAAVGGSKIAPDGIVKGKIATGVIEEKSYRPASIPLSKLKDLRQDRINLYDYSKNVLDAAIKPDGTDWYDASTAGYARTDYLDVRGLLAVELRIPITEVLSASVTSSVIFFYAEPGEKSISAEKIPTLFTVDNKYNAYRFNVPSTANFMRFRVKVTNFWDYNNAKLNILGITKSGSRDLKSNNEILSDTNLNEYFLKSAEVLISENLYEFSKSEIGGLEANGTESTLEGYSRSHFIPLNNGEDAEGLSFVWTRDNLTRSNLDYSFLYKAGVGKPSSTEILKISDVENYVENGRIQFKVPTGGYRYARIVDKNPNTTEEVAKKQVFKRLLDNENDVVIKGKKLSDIFLRRDETVSNAKSNLMQIFPKYTTIGDSLTAGYININGTTILSSDAAKTKNNWPGYLSLRTGRTFTNIAIGGSTAKDWRNTHISSADIETDCYIIRIGVNDRRQSLSVGTAADIKTDFTTNSDSFYGNYDYMIRQIMTYNPKAKLFVFTLPAYEGTESTAYNSAIKNIANLYSNVHCIDLYNLFYAEYTTGFISSNFIGGHLSPLAYNYESTLIENAICDYIYEHYTDFLVVPYA